MCAQPTNYVATLGGSGCHVWHRTQPTMRDGMIEETWRFPQWITGKELRLAERGLLEPEPFTLDWWISRVPEREDAEDFACACRPLIEKTPERVS